MADCVFCRIVAGDAPASIVDEDELTLAFMDLNPVTQGHVLVIPKAHAENIYDCTEEQASAMMCMGARIARSAKTAFECAGVNYWMANEPAAGQVVMHAHLHVIPRYPNDGVSLRHSYARSRGARQELDALARQLRQQIEGEKR